MIDVAFDELMDAIDGVERVLALGGAASAIGRELERRGAVSDVVTGDWPSIQLDRRYRLAVATGLGAGELVAAVHCGVQHLLPAGRLVVDGDHIDRLGTRFDLQPVMRASAEGAHVGLLCRSERQTIHDLVFRARARIVRTTAAELARRLARSDAPTVVDTRTAIDRQRFGVIAGSIHVPRTVLEWHLDPANGYRHPAVRSRQQPLVLVCNGGYSSSLAVASLLDLGFTDACDLVGGMRAWIASGHPVVEPDHCHLDL